MQPMPTGGFTWMPREEIDTLNLNDYDDYGKTGLILEVDLKYPEELHDSHNDYPMAPEKMTVSKDMLSPTSSDMFEKLHLNAGKVEKLVPNLKDKKKYVVHYRNLKFYLKHGLKIEKIHDVLKFNQSPWIAKYMQFNTTRRANAKTEFQKDNCKLMNNR